MVQILGAYPPPEHQLWQDEQVQGEFLTVSLLEEKGYDPLVYRFFCLQSHYRKGLVFSWENLDNAKAAYDKLVARVAALSGEGTVDEGAVERFKNDFLETVGNDLKHLSGGYRPVRCAQSPA